MAIQPNIFTDELALLDQIKALNERSIAGVDALVAYDQLLKLTKEYEACLLKRHVDLDLNLFAIVSDLYYRENFHSDILRAWFAAEPLTESLKSLSDLQSIC